MRSGTLRAGIAGLTIQKCSGPASKKTVLRTAPSDAEETSRDIGRAPPSCPGRRLDDFRPAGGDLVVGEQQPQLACGGRRARSCRRRARPRWGRPAPPSGAMWPTISPCVARENRPSVISATSSPSPSPTSAAVTCSISRIPRTPGGPLPYRITTTSPAVIVRALTAAKHSSSDSNTRAGPLWNRRSWPASFHDEPSGARLPAGSRGRRSPSRGRSIGTTTSWPGVSTTAAATCAMRAPVDVRRVAVHEALLEQLARDERDAACGVEIRRDEAGLPARCRR